MSVVQIIEELPKLTPGDRRVIERRIQELDEYNGDMLFVSEAARLAFQEIDREEEAHAKRKAG